MITVKMKTLIKFFLVLLFSFNINANEKGNKNQYRFSILSIGEGSSLADAFGHTGIRVRDTITNDDIVFNFGIYDFNSPNFYSNFVKGRPQYKLGVQKYENFSKNYKLENRYIIEHIINLNENSSKKIIELLVENLKNPNYTYDYLRDNCATRVADILIDKSSNKLKTESLNEQGTDTYRNLIHSKINENSWGALGIDICLGAVIDKKITLRETLFLPENVMNYLTQIQKENPELISQQTIFKPKGLKKLPVTKIFTSPLFINIFLSIIIIFFTLLGFKKGYWFKSIDFIIFFVTGFIGLLIIYLWFFSNHFASAQNFNFLWAFPFNLTMIYALLRKNTPKWANNFVKLNIIMLLLLFIHWLTGVQKYNITLLPIFVTLLFRYFYLVFQINKKMR